MAQLNRRYPANTKHDPSISLEIDVEQCLKRARPVRAVRVNVVEDDPPAVGQQVGRYLHDASVAPTAAWEHLLGSYTYPLRTRNCQRILSFGSREREWWCRLPILCMQFLKMSHRWTESPTFIHAASPILCIVSRLTMVGEVFATNRSYEKSLRVGSIHSMPKSKSV